MLLLWSVPEQIDKVFKKKTWWSTGSQRGLVQGFNEKSKCRIISTSPFQRNIKNQPRRSREKNPKFESARRSKNQEDKLVMCANCKIFLKSKSMARNAKICALPKESIQIKMITKPTVQKSDEFKTHVLALLRNIT